MITLEGFEDVLDIYFVDEKGFVFSSFIAKNSDYQTVVVTNIISRQKYIFPTNREARRFFENKINVSDAIKYNWLVRKTYRISILDYCELIDSPNLQE